MQEEILSEAFEEMHPDEDRCIGLGQVSLLLEKIGRTDL